MTAITSLTNPKVKLSVKLRQHNKRRDTRLFLIEGYRELLRAIDAGHPVQTLFYCPELFLGENERELIERTDAEILSCSPDVFRKISYRDRPDGLLAIAPQQAKTLESFHQPTFLVIAEAIEKPGNLGTILRSCDAVGADGLIVCDQCTDLFNPNVVRASVGTLFTVPTVQATTQELLPWLREKKISIVATTPHTSLNYTQADYTKPLALVLGTEQLGLSKTWLQEADIQVKIPMRGIADSLNVATATTVMLYEVLRQRSL